MSRRRAPTRGVPGPAVGKRPNASPVWRPTTVRSLLMNPFYAGYLAQRNRVQRGKATQNPLKVADYILSDAPGDWPVILSLPDWYALLAQMSGRASQGCQNRSGLLTSLLFNHCGQRMQKAMRFSYECRCDQPYPGVNNPRRTHPGRSISAPKIEAWVKECVVAVLAALPPDLPALAARMRKQAGSSASSPAAARAALMALQRDIAEKRRTAEDLMLRRAYYVQQFGEGVWQDTVARCGRELAVLQEEAQRRESEARQPEMAPTLVLLESVQRTGAATFFEMAEAGEQIRLIQGLVCRVELGSDLRAYPHDRWRHLSATLTWWPWLVRVLGDALPAQPPLPARHLTGAFANEREDRRKRKEQREAKEADRSGVSDGGFEGE